MTDVYMQNIVFQEHPSTTQKLYAYDVRNRNNDRNEEQGNLLYLFLWSGYILLQQATVKVLVTADSGEQEARNNDHGQPRTVNHQQ